jgi:hypothetical protein
LGVLGIFLEAGVKLKQPDKNWNCDRNTIPGTSNTHILDLLYVLGDSESLSGFPWPIIFKSKKKKVKLLTEYESVTQKVF